MSASYLLSKRGIGLITLDNAPVNALSRSLRLGIMAGLEKARADKVEAVILRGKGGLLCAGADIKEFMKGSYKDDPRLHDIIGFVEDMPSPVVAHMQGVTMGGGVELCLASHWRVADKSSRISLPEVHLGILPGAGGTQRLPRLVGANRAFELMTTGRILSASDALQYGLVDMF